MASTLKRGVSGIAGLIASTGLTPSKSTKLQALAEELGKEMEANGISPMAMDFSDASTTASSSPPTGKKGRGKGGGKGRGGRGAQNQAPKEPVGKGDTNTRLSTLEKLIVMLMRMVCLNTNELRRQARENQQCAKFIPGKVTEALESQHEQWKSELKKETEDSFPLHPEGPLRFFTFQRLWVAVRAEGSHPDEQMKKALDLLTDMPQIKKGLLRFYRLREPSKDAEEGSDASMEMWIIRCDKSPAGQKLLQAIEYLNQTDALQQVQMTIQDDRAPKSGLQKGIEDALNKVSKNKE